MGVRRGGVGGGDNDTKKKLLQNKFYVFGCRKYENMKIRPYIL